MGIQLLTLIVKVFICANTLTDRTKCIQVYLECLETNLIRQTEEMQDSLDWSVLKSLSKVAPAVKTSSNGYL